MRSILQVPKCNYYVILKQISVRFKKVTSYFPLGDVSDIKVILKKQTFSQLFLTVLLIFSVL